MVATPLLSFLGWMMSLYQCSDSTRPSGNTQNDKKYLLLEHNTTPQKAKIPILKKTPLPSLEGNTNSLSENETILEQNKNLAQKAHKDAIQRCNLEDNKNIKEEAIAQLKNSWGVLTNAWEELLDAKNKKNTVFGRVIQEHVINSENEMTRL
jgi:beta-N-acetylglucosaminidase